MKSLALVLSAMSAYAASPALPVRGLHVGAPRPEEVPQTVKFIEEALRKEGVNTLVLEVGYRYQFRRRPEVADRSGLSQDDVARLVAAARKAGVRLIPQLNCLGHQSWAKSTQALLRAYPDFDETPGRYPENQGIYCRSYCPLHPKVHEVLFDLIDELADAFESDAFHVGMDEVFLLGEDDCARCRGRNKAELFAGEVQKLHRHLAASKRQLWMWGDRFLDGETTGIGKWEAAVNGTHPALRMIPKDIVICDWHYEKPHPTAAYFALEGFPVVSSPWRKADVALGQFELMREARARSAGVVAERMLGMLQTTWCGMGPFLKAYYNEPGATSNAIEAAACFRALFREIRAAEGR